MPVLTAGDHVNGYQLVSALTNRECTTGKWAFARKEGKEFFLKQFMAPKYPVAGAAGSKATIERKLAQCERFETQQRKLKQTLAKVAKGYGALVETTDFFRVDSFYYKVTPKVDVMGLSVEEISGLSLPHRLTMMLTAASSLGGLHSQSVVHGDLKPANILVKRTKESYATRLIDFDGSFFEREPPDAGVIQGDYPYYSPELMAYVSSEGDHPESLTTMSDVFALGIVFSEYLAGAKPDFDRSKNTYLCQAVSKGSAAKWPSRRKGREPVARELETLVLSMLSRAPADRPTMFTVLTRLQAFNKMLITGELGRGEPAPPAPGPPSPERRYPDVLRTWKETGPAAPEGAEEADGASAPAPAPDRPALRLGNWPRRG